MTNEGSEAGKCVGPDIKMAELAPNPTRPSRGEHVNLLWQILQGLDRGRISSEKALAAVELSKRIEEIQKRP